MNETDKIKYFGAHIWCEIHNGKVWINNGCNADVGIVSLIDENKENFAKELISNCQLLLTDLKNITDEHAVEVSSLILKDSSLPYNFNFNGKIVRNQYDNSHGTDAEESVSVYFDATCDELYKSAGWKDETFFVKIIIRDRYNESLYFTAHNKSDTKTTWSLHYIGNSQEATDKLRELFYAIPFGKYSVEELIEANVLILKS